MDPLRPVAHHVSERRAGEVIRRVGDARLRDTFNNAAVGMAHLGPTGHWLSVNARLCAILGYDEADLLRTDFTSLLHPDDGPCTLPLLPQPQVDRVLERRLLRGDGSAIWVNITISPGRADPGGSRYLIAVIEDISARKSAELRLQAALEASATGTFDWDIANGTVHCDASLCKLLGLAADEAVLLVDDLLARAHASDRPTLQEKLERCRTEGDNFDAEFRLGSPDGDERWMAARGRTLRDHRGQPASMIGACVDVTERKHAEMVLVSRELASRQALETLSLAQKAARVGTWDWSIATGLVTWTDEARRLFGFTRSTAITFDEWIACVHPDDRERTARAARDQRHNDQYRDVFRVLHPDGTLLWIEAEGRLMRDPAGAPLRMVGTVRNVTERHLAEEAMRAAERQKDHFLATLAHELRNPLAPIRNGVEILRRLGEGQPTITRLADLLDRQSGHMVRLVDDLLDIARISSGKIELQYEPFPIQRVVLHAVDVAQPLVTEARHKLVVSVPEPGIELQGDFLRVAQILSNLINNAVKYTPAGGRIRISARRHEQGVLFEVADNGWGIDPQLAPRIFDLFVQADATLDRARGGLGIGLSLVRKLAQLHGGRVSVHSLGIGQGSTFTVWLPLRPAAQPGRDQPPADASAES
jgi:PAS domain S-box-containing protein